MLGRRCVSSGGGHGGMFLHSCHVVNCSFVKQLLRDCYTGKISYTLVTL